MPRLPEPKRKQPPIQRDEWDSSDTPSLEHGTVDELKERLIALMEDQLARLKGDKQDEVWQPNTPTWPYSRLGLKLLRCIRIADAIIEKMGKQ